MYKAHLNKHICRKVKFLQYWLTKNSVAYAEPYLQVDSLLTHVTVMV